MLASDHNEVNLDCFPSLISFQIPARYTTCWLAYLWEEQSPDLFPVCRWLAWPKESFISPGGLSPIFLFKGSVWEPGLDNSGPGSFCHHPRCIIVMGRDLVPSLVSKPCSLDHLWALVQFMMLLCLALPRDFAVAEVRGKQKSQPQSLWACWPFWPWPAYLFQNSIFQIPFQILLGCCLLIPCADPGLNQKDMESSYSLWCSISWHQTLQTLEWDYFIWSHVRWRWPWKAETGSLNGARDQDWRCLGIGNLMFYFSELCNFFSL